MKAAINRLSTQLGKRMEAISKERDRLDALIDEAKQLKGNCEDAYDAMQTARDALSELV